MKTLSGKNSIYQKVRKQAKSLKNATVSGVLKAAYKLHFRDKNTRQAVKRCLG